MTFDAFCRRKARIEPFVRLRLRFPPHGIRVMRCGRDATEMLGEIGELIRSGKLRGRVGPVFPLSKAAAVHDPSQTGHSDGRILIAVAE